MKHEDNRNIQLNKQFQKHRFIGLNWYLFENISLITSPNHNSGCSKELSNLDESFEHPHPWILRSNKDFG